MKKFINKLNELQKMLILAALVAFVLLLLSLIPLFAFKQTGWLIGIAIGSAIEILNIFLLYKGNEFVTKGKKLPLFLVFYALRMILFAFGFLLTAFLGFGFKYAGNTLVAPVNAFINSLWGVLIAYTPLQIVVIIVMLASNKSELSLRKEKEQSNG